MDFPFPVSCINCNDKQLECKASSHLKGSCHHCFINGIECYFPVAAVAASATASHGVGVYLFQRNCFHCTKSHRQCRPSNHCHSPCSRCTKRGLPILYQLSSQGRRNDLKAGKTPTEASTTTTKTRTLMTAASTATIGLTATRNRLTTTKTTTTSNIVRVYSRIPTEMTQRKRTTTVTTTRIPTEMTQRKRTTTVMPSSLAAMSTSTSTTAGGAGDTSDPGGRFAITNESVHYHHRSGSHLQSDGYSCHGRVEQVKLNENFSIKTLASSYETQSCRRHPPARPPVLKNVGPRQRGRLPGTKPQPQMVFPKWAKSIISNNLDWSESTVPGEICLQNKAMQIECDDNCRGGAGCSNKRIQRYKVKKVKKKRVGKGFGLFADEDIPKGEYVIEYIGKIVNKDPKNEYGMKYKDFPLWVDGSKTNALAKRINHSCNPNCANHMWAIKGMPRLCFFANRNIFKGQELTFSYGWTLPKKDLKRKGTVCLCGEKSCSGTIEKCVEISKKVS